MHGLISFQELLVLLGFSYKNSLFYFDPSGNSSALASAVDMSLCLKLHSCSEEQQFFFHVLILDQLISNSELPSFWLMEN